VKFEKLVAKVVGFVEQPRLGLDLPLDVQGTAFQQRVWKALRQIDAGRPQAMAILLPASAVPSRFERWPGLRVQHDRPLQFPVTA